MADIQYFQCRLRMGDAEQTAWIEKRGATVGARVEILPTKELWTVTEVFEPGLSGVGMQDLKRLNRKSLPSIEPMG